MCSTYLSHNLVLLITLQNPVLKKKDADMSMIVQHRQQGGTHYKHLVHIMNCVLKYNTKI